MIEVVLHEDPATFLEQGHNLVKRTVAGIHQRYAQRRACQHMQQRRMRGAILWNPPLVRGTPRACHVDPYNILKCPESGTPRLIGLKRHMHHAREIAMLDLHLDGASRARLSVASQQLGDVAISRLTKEYVLNMGRLVDLVGPETPAGDEIEFLPGVQVLDLATQTDRHRSQTLGNTERVGRVFIILKRKGIDLLLGRMAVDINRADRENRILQQCDIDRLAVEQQLGPDCHRTGLSGDQLFAPQEHTCVQRIAFAQMLKLAQYRIAPTGEHDLLFSGAAAERNMNLAVLSLVLCPGHPHHRVLNHLARVI